MDRVKSQAAVVSQLLFDPKTAGMYKDVLALTGKIIKEVALLAWLLICSVLVFGAWFSDTAVGAGRNARAWWQAQQAESVDGSQAATATGQAFLDVSQNGASFLLDKAREQLGLEKVERPAKKSSADAVKSQGKTAAPKASTTANAAADKIAAVANDVRQAVNKDVSPSKDPSESSVAEKH
jgi:type IV secretory pathway TrbL component